jgi:hypothetical protein
MRGSDGAYSGGGPSGAGGTPAPQQDIQALLANLSAYKPPT